MTDYVKREGELTARLARALDYFALAVVAIQQDVTYIPGPQYGPKVGEDYNLHMVATQLRVIDDPMLVDAIDKLGVAIWPYALERGLLQPTEKEHAT